MNRRIVYPAPSFQPPETCTEHEECRAGQASNADLCRAAQAHYDKVSTAAHEWHSAIPKAIDAYYTDPERARLERVVIEASKARRCARDAMFRKGTEEGCRDYEASDWQYEAALSSLLEFESPQQQIKK